MNQVEQDQVREKPGEAVPSTLSFDKFDQQDSVAVRGLMQCLREICSEGPTFVLLLESSLDERCINDSDIDLLGTTTAVESLLATCFSWAQSGRCHFRVKRKREGNISLVLFSRCGQFRIQFDLFTDLWQLDGGRCGLRFEDVAHLLSPGQPGFVRLPGPVEAAIYLHKYVVKKRSIESDRIRQRLIGYSLDCRQAGATEFAADLDAVLQYGRVEPAALTRATQLLRSYNVVPSLTNSWQSMRRHWIARWRRWWLGVPRRSAVISFMGCDGAGKTSLSEGLSKDSSLPVTLKPFVGRNLYRKSPIYRIFGSLFRRSLSINRDRFDEKFCLPLYLQAAAHLRRKVYWRQLLGSQKLLVMDRTLVDLLYTQRLSDEAKFGRWVRLADYFGIRLPTVHFVVDFERLHSRKAECSEIAHRQYDEDMFWFHVRRIPTDYTVFSNCGTFDDSRTALTHVIQANWPRRRAA